MGRVAIVQNFLLTTSLYWASITFPGPQMSFCSSITKSNIYNLNQLSS